jgi:rod shape-determining protein MreC
VLGIALLGQLLLMAYQLRRNRDVPLVRYGAVLVVSPVQKGLSGMVHGVQAIWFGYIDLHGARRDNTELVRQLDAMRLENNRLREQSGELKRLQALLDLREQVAGRTLVARVVGASSSETARMVTLDKGRNHGIEPDMPVLVPEGVVGKVLHVFPEMAQVLLLTDPYSGVACLVQDSRVHGVLKGQNQSLGTLAYVPNGEPISPGQKVVTSGEDQVYPKGLPVGVVVEAKPGLESQQVTVQLLAPLNRLDEVLVILQTQTGPPPEEQQLTRAAPPTAGSEAAAPAEHSPAVVGTAPLSAHPQNGGSASAPQRGDPPPAVPPAAPAAERSGMPPSDTSPAAPPDAPPSEGRPASQAETSPEVPPPVPTTEGDPQPIKNP